MKHIRYKENMEQNSGDEDGETFSKQKSGQITNEIDYGSGDEESTTIKWYQDLPDDPVATKPLPEERIAELKKEGSLLLHSAGLAYETKLERSGSSDQKWARSLLMKGAMGDRLAAAYLLIQENPMFHLTTLKNLVAMVKPAKKKDSLMVIDTLRKLFVSDLLLPDSKLRPFEARPASELEKMTSGNKDHMKKILMAWSYEDQLKSVFAEFIKGVNTFAHDAVEAHREKAVVCLFQLLAGNPEQEKVLLSSIVNKLGDPSQKVASKVTYYLNLLLFTHSNMKGVVLGEIEKMVFRPNISPKAQYYGVCTLNQFILNKDDSKVAENLVRVYFSFFKANIKQGEVDSRLMSGILTGVRRCQPFIREDALPALRTHEHALHRLVHLASEQVSLQALALLHQLSPLGEQMGDRFYCALYKKLGSLEMLNTTQPALLLNLVYRSLKADTQITRVWAFLKRLLQLAGATDAPRACALLLVVARLSRQHRLSTILPEIKTEDEIKEEDENESKDVNGKTTEDESSKKNDKNEKKIKDSKLMKIAQGSGLTTMDLLNDDDEEVYHDIPLEEDLEEYQLKAKRVARMKKAAPGWQHTQLPTMDLTAEQAQRDMDEPAPQGEEFSKKTDKDKEMQILFKKHQNINKVNLKYTPLSRNPAYCGAQNTLAWELHLLNNHYHPSVRLFAEKILQGMVIFYPGDPLKDFSAARFLDRFAFKNPKKAVPAASHSHLAKRRYYTASGLRSLPVNSAAYLNENEDHIPADERFLYDYLRMRRSQKGDESDAESDAGSVDSDEFERYLDGVAGTKKSKDDASDDEEMDFMKEMLEHSRLEKGKKKSKKAAEAAEADEDDDEDVDSVGSMDDSLEGSDDDDESLVDEEDDEDLDLDISESEEENDTRHKSKKMKTISKKKKGKGDSESDLDFSEDDDDDEAMVVPGKRKKGPKGKQSVFASAEEFAELLEETATTKGHGTSQAMANTDNANLKQLNWESKRDHWVKGGAKNKTGGRPNFQTKKSNINRNKNFQGIKKRPANKRR